MDAILFLFVGIMCLYLGIKTYFAEETNNVFVKYKIQVNDVKKYNHFCAGLIIGFGVVAEITMFAMLSTGGWIGLIFTALIVVEAIALVKIYQAGEKKFIVKR